MSEKADETNAANAGDSTNAAYASSASKKENLWLLKATLLAVKGRITKALNTIDPTIENFAGYENTGTSDWVMDAIASEMQIQYERLMKNLKQ